MYQKQIECIFEVIDSLKHDDLRKIGLVISGFTHTGTTSEYTVDVFRSLDDLSYIGRERATTILPSQRFRFYIKRDVNKKVTFVERMSRINEVYNKIVPFLRDKKLKELGI